VSDGHAHRFDDLLSLVESIQKREKGWPSADTPDGEADIARLSSRIRTDLVSRTRYLQTIVKHRRTPRPSLKETVRVIAACDWVPISFGHTGFEAVDRHAQLYLETHPDNYRVLGPTSRFNAEEWTNRIDKLLCDAYALNPDVVVLPEFAFPQLIELQGVYGESDVEQAKRLGSVLKTKFKDTMNLKNADQVFGVLGTFHCRRALLNQAVVAPSGCDPVKYEKQIIEHTMSDAIAGYTIDEVTAPLLIAKRFPARRAGEQTRVPPTMECRIFEEAFGNIAVLVCSDVLDLNQFNSIVLHNRTAGPEAISLVTVPAYNRSPELNDACRELSYLAGCCVLVVNSEGRHFNRDGVRRALPDSKFFIGGIDFTPTSEREVHDNYFGVKMELVRVGNEARLLVIEYSRPKITAYLSWLRERISAHEGPLELDF